MKPCPNGSHILLGFIWSLSIASNLSKFFFTRVEMERTSNLTQMHPKSHNSVSPAVTFFVIRHHNGARCYTVRNDAKGYVVEAGHRPSSRACLEGRDTLCSSGIQGGVRESGAPYRIQGQPMELDSVVRSNPTRHEQDIEEWFIPSHNRGSCFENRETPDPTAQWTVASLDARKQDILIRSYIFISLINI